MHVSIYFYNLYKNIKKYFVWKDFKTSYNYFTPFPFLYCFSFFILDGSMRLEMT